MRKNKISSRSCPSKLWPFVVVSALQVEIPALKKKNNNNKRRRRRIASWLFCVRPHCYRLICQLAARESPSRWWLPLSRAAGSFRYSCDICGKKYKYYSCFQEHRDLHAVDGNPGEPSPVCIAASGTCALYSGQTRRLAPPKCCRMFFILQWEKEKRETLSNGCKCRNMHK